MSECISRDEAAEGGGRLRVQTMPVTGVLIRYEVDSSGEFCVIALDGGLRMHESGRWWVGSHELRVPRSMVQRAEGAG